MNALHRRVVEISKKYQLSHIGSSLTAVNIIKEIYETKKGNEPFILSCGHAGLGLYVVLEDVFGFDAEDLFLKYGPHPNRCEEDDIHCSTGSLGHGLPIALGMALADRSKDVYCLISDGESYEGSIWETSNVLHKYKVNNLKIYLNFNGWSAYDKVEGELIRKVEILFPNIKIRMTRVEDYGLKGLSAHYIKL